MNNYTYIIEEHQNSYGVTIYKNGEMLSSFTDWFDTEAEAYAYSQNCLAELKNHKE